jgi:hypothetical protein
MVRGGELEFPAYHARVLLRIARDPGARLRQMAASLGITERSAYGSGHRPDRRPLHGRR